MDATGSRIWCPVSRCAFSGNSRLRASVMYVLSFSMTGLISAAAHAVTRENAPAAMIQPVLCSQLRRVRPESFFFGGVSAHGSFFIGIHLLACSTVQGT